LEVALLKPKLNKLLTTLYKNFKNIVVVDYEFRHVPGENPIVVCGVYKELKSGIVIVVKGSSLNVLPYSFKDTLFIGFQLNAEAACMLELGFGLPSFCWDLFIIEKKLFNGAIPNAPGAYSLIKTSERYGIHDAMSEQEKTNNRDLIINNTSYTKQEMKRITDYCTEDVLLTEKLFFKQSEYLEQDDHDTGRSISTNLFHSKANAYTAKVERNGIPIDAELYNDFQRSFPEIAKTLIEETNKELNVYVDGKFNHIKFSELLSREKLTDRWPKTKTGKFKTDRKTVYKFSVSNKAIDQFRLCQEFIGCNNLKGYQVGSDGRSRCYLNMFGQKTGRTNASPAKYPFGAPRWARTFIKPDPGKVLAYIDYRSQEPAIQFSLSRDPELKAAYETGDIYMYTAIKAGAVPKGSSKKTHPQIRELYKLSFLASGYGQEAFGLSKVLNIHITEARKILSEIRAAYTVYYKWIDAWKDRAIVTKRARTKYGWQIHFTPNEIINPRSMLNWPIQSHGSEILRVAMLNLIDEKIELSALVHDAVMVHIPQKNLKVNILKIKNIMLAASEQVIGYRIPVDVQIIRGHFEQEGKEKDKWDFVIGKYNQTKVVQPQTAPPAIY